MNIIILGDSWGVPNYYGPPGVAPEAHTEFLLKELGHTVYNCANNAGSNIDSIIQATDHSHIGTADLIIWFHTELTRDIEYIEPGSLDETIERLAHETYKRIAELKNLTKAKLVAIGGCATLHPLLFDYVTPDFYITDWVSSICGQEVPPCYISYSIPKKIPKQLPDRELAQLVVDTKENLTRQFDIELKRYKCMSHSEHFPDNSHPGIQPHLNLVNTLKNTYLRFRCRNG